MPKPKLYLFFSHQLTEEQVKDAQENLNVSETVYLPEVLQEVWSDVAAETEDIQKELIIFTNWLNEQNSQAEDYVLIQGDFGLSYALVEYCKQNKRGIPIYATTARSSQDIKNPDGSIKSVRLFKHKRFRKY